MTNLEDPQRTPAEATDAPGKPAPANRWLLFVVLLSLGFLIPTFMLLRAAAMPSARAAHAARHGFIQLDNEEGALLFQAEQIAGGQSIYHSLSAPPYVAGTYTPFYMAAVAAVDQFRAASFTKGRVIVWAAAFGIAALLVLLATVTTRNAPLGVMAGILFLATWEVYQWIAYFRVDFPAIFLSLAGLAVVVAGRGRHLALAVGALLMVLALFTKQTTVAAPVACFLALLFHRPGRALAFAGWLLLCGVPAVIGMQMISNGEFLKHIIVYNMNAWHLNDLRIWSRHVWNMHRWFFIAGIFAAAWGVVELSMAMARRSRTPDPSGDGVLFSFWQPVAWYALLAQWNFFGIAKSGSAENYLLEPIAGWALMICLVCGYALRSIVLLDSSTVYKVARLVVITLVLGSIITHAIVVNEPVSMQMRFNPAKNPGRADFEASELLRARMRGADNPLSELAIYHLQTDSEPVIQPFIMSELARQGQWNQSPFVADVAAAKFDVVIALDDLTKALPTPKWTHEMLQAFHSAYELDRILYTPLWQYHILVPRKEPAGNTPMSDIAAAELSPEG